MAREPAGSPILEPVLTLTLTLSTGLPEPIVTYSNDIHSTSYHLQFRK